MTPPTNGHPAPVPLGGSRIGTSQPHSTEIVKPPPQPTPYVGPEPANPTVNGGEKGGKVAQPHTPKHPQPSKGPLGIVGHPTCTATSKRSGLPCQCYPMRGSKVCSTHGGMAPQVKAKAAQRMTLQAVEAEAASVLAFHGIAGVFNPLEEVARLTAETRATLDGIAARVNALDVIRYSASGAGTEQTRAEMVLLGQYQDRLARLLDMMMRWDFDNRRLLLNEYLVKATVTFTAGPFMDGVVDGLRDELIAVSADATKDDFPKVWKDVIGRVLPAAFRALPPFNGGHDEPA